MKKLLTLLLALPTLYTVDLNAALLRLKKTGASLQSLRFSLANQAIRKAHGGLVLQSLHKSQNGTNKKKNESETCVNPQDLLKQLPPARIKTQEDFDKVEKVLQLNMTIDKAIEEREKLVTELINSGMWMIDWAQGTTVYLRGQPRYCKEKKAWVIDEVVDKHPNDKQVTTRVWALSGPYYRRFHGI